MVKRMSMARLVGTVALLGYTWLAAWPSPAAELGTIRLGVLAFGTVNWELDVIQHHDLDAAEGFELEVQGFGGGNATNVALLGGAVDAIVDDWLWVSRQRTAGERLTFIPYSSSVGALMVQAEAGIDDLGDLAGTTIGIAGGPIDKSWLLLRAVAKKEHGIDLVTETTQAFGAPPLLTEKFRSGELDAVINYWHYAARLEAEGYQRLIGVEDAQAQLGAARDTPQLGYVFAEAWANANAELVQAFSRASRAAKTIMATSDEEWERLRELTKAGDDATLEALKRRFREGIVGHWGDAERTNAAKLYEVLAEIGGEDLVGNAPTLAPGTFFAGVRY